MEQWGGTARNLAQTDAMRLLVTFSRMLPLTAARRGYPENANLLGRLPDRFFHARLQGIKLGVFDVLFDSLAAEQVEAGQAKTAEDGTSYYDVWTSFSPNPPADEDKNAGGASGPGNPSPTGGLDRSSTLHDSDRGAASEADSRPSAEWN